MLPRSLNRFAAKTVLPLGALAILSMGAATGASAQTCPTIDCSPVTTATLRPQQLIVNGGFENGRTGWSLNGGTSVGTVIAHCGTASLALRTYYIGGSGVFWPDWWAGEADQTVNIPANSNGAYLDFWAYLPKYTPQREADISLLVAAPSNGDIYTVVASYSNATVPGGLWRHFGPIDLTRYQGGPAYLMFEASTPRDGSTSVFLDDIALRTGPQLQIVSGGGC